MAMSSVAIIQVGPSGSGRNGGLQAHEPQTGGSGTLKGVVDQEHWCRARGSIGTEADREIARRARRRRAKAIPGMEVNVTTSDTLSHEPEIFRLDGGWYADNTDEAPSWRMFHSGWAGGVDGPFCGQFCMLAEGHPGPHMMNQPALEAHLIGRHMARYARPLVDP